jgi:hypothetical protein
MDGNPVDGTALSPFTLRRVTAASGIRALLWDKDTLYGCQGYKIVRLRAGGLDWEPLACFRPAWWRTLTSRNALSSRLLRDGFHALTVLPDGTMVGAVPGAIVTQPAGSAEFHVSHRMLRGTRPLHITAVPSGTIYWGEYFDNRGRDEVHIYASQDRGSTWHIAYTFPAGVIRHVHNIVYDRWGDCLWILTGDEGSECRILRASCDLRSTETVLAGSQQTRAVAAIPSPDSLYLSTDTPHEQNHVYRMDRSGHLECVGNLNSSSIYGCRAGQTLFFSTMAEPSAVNTSQEVHLVGSRDGDAWLTLAHWKKDSLSMKYFQYGNAFLPDGENATDFLAVTTVAVEQDDQTTTLWQIT